MNNIGVRWIPKTEKPQLVGSRDRSTASQLSERAAGIAGQENTTWKYLPRYR